MIRRRSWKELRKTRQQYCIFNKVGLPITSAFLMLIIIENPPILQVALGTINTNLSTNNATSTTDTRFKSFILASSNQSSTSSADKTNVTLRGLLNQQIDSGSWNQMLQPALDELNRRHPDMNIGLEYTELPDKNISLNQTLDRLSKGETVDIISVDQYWLGEFAQRGLIENLTQKFEEWGRIPDLYETNLDGCVYNGTLYALWLWTDVRGMWYWKDMLQEAGVDPESLKTWDGYISAAVKLKDHFGNNITQGVHLVGASHSPDMWYPYLWMLGGEILEPREGHPTKEGNWFPAYNSSAGVRAMEFLKQQVDAGIKPQKNHSWGAEFANRSFPVMLEGSWLPREFQNESWPTLEPQVGFIPMFPVPNETIQTSTMMGGWELAIPSKSQHSDLAWELITIVAQPEVLARFLRETGYLPTQRTMGEGQQYSELLRESIPFFAQTVSMIPYGQSRPNIPEYPKIAEDIRQAIQQVYNGTASPKEALDMAAAKSAATLGWK